MRSIIFRIRQFRGLHHIDALHEMLRRRAEVEAIARGTEKIACEFFAAWNSHNWDTLHHWHEQFVLCEDHFKRLLEKWRGDFKLVETDTRQHLLLSARFRWATLIRNKELCHAGLEMSEAKVSVRRAIVEGARANAERNTDLYGRWIEQLLVCNKRFDAALAAYNETIKEAVPVA